MVASCTLRRHTRCGSIVLFGILSFLFLFNTPAFAQNENHTIRARNGVVVSVSAPASDVGVQILKQGGNAVDAAVATAFALAVTYPQAGNIGGGGFMMVHPPDAKPVCIDYREMAPAAVNKDTFAQETNYHNHRIVGVPGTVRGLALAHEKFGKLPWKNLVAPAVELASKGFALDDHLAKDLNRYLVMTKRKFPEFQRVFSKPDGTPWKAGDVLVQPDLARTLQLIADQGPDAFYTGAIADQIAAEMKAGQGFITKEDLANYKAKIRQPIHCQFRGFDVYGPPPPSSGGICLAIMLNTLENFDLKKMGRWSLEANHLIIEAMRRAFYDRARYLGDSDFVEIPDHLTSDAYGQKLARSIDSKLPTSSRELSKDIPLVGESDSTTHFSIVDKNGMAIANTYTLENSFGSRIVVKGAGFLLNNEMGDFNWKPGHTDRKGRIGTPPNQVAPGKRMLSSMTPTIVAKDGKVLLVTGSPGGRTIINTVLCVVLNVLEFDMNVRDAVDAPRMHHQWFPDIVQFEGGKVHLELVSNLKKMGHVLNRTRQGDAHTIWIDPQSGEYVGAADHRLSGKAAGY